MVEFDWDKPAKTEKTSVNLTGTNLQKQKKHLIFLGISLNQKYLLAQKKLCL